MSPPVAIALAYGVVAAGIWLYLRRVRRRMRDVEADLAAHPSTEPRVPAGR